ncbi:FAD/NAD(P)-binding domain-containing protein [Patellaria atrata CBS 101060]|uniref:FAD/NAD(P)-binding domain-containing protein n=1 Tax=Patellaria atrata CBS 101060 TaxID=1346257 RepID=A0A9P4VQL4_9PEZI|nr:FAD/NAD(P)-binding domain-containing protein [Patellaria atrata CBS 101060]
MALEALLTWPAGLITAKTYLQASPTARVLLLDSSNTLGGTWSQDRLYPHLLAETRHGHFEFSDLRMGTEGVNSDGTVSGDAIHAYLVRYAEKFNLLKILRNQTKVIRVQRKEGGMGWYVGIVPVNEQGKELGDGEEVLRAEKLVVATGMTSHPFIPSIPDYGFRGQIIHSKEMGTETTRELLRNEKIKAVVVYGGSKSAFDAVYMLLKAGKGVEWVIRHGNGTANMTPLTIWGMPTSRASATRIWGLFSPSIFAEDSWWKRWLQSNLVIKGYWRFMTYMVQRPAQYWKTENGRRLRPDMGYDNLFYSPATQGVSNHPEFWDMVHNEENVKVWRNSILSYEENSVILDNGTQLPAELVVLATGWKVKQNLFSDQDAQALGLPSEARFDAETRSKWSKLNGDAEKEILLEYPSLRDSPTGTLSREENDYCLYRYLIPSSYLNDDRSIGFIGFLRTASNPMVYEAQALWLTAYLLGVLNVPSQEKREREVARSNAWMWRRYMSGRRMPFAFFDFISYVDLLYRDLGINTRRKSNILAELFGQYQPRDYQGVVDEWLQKTRKVERVQMHSNKAGNDPITTLTRCT